MEEERRRNRGEKAADDAAPALWLTVPCAAETIRWIRRTHDRRTHGHDATHGRVRNRRTLRGHSDARGESCEAVPAGRRRLRALRHDAPARQDDDEPRGR